MKRKSYKILRMRALHKYMPHLQAYSHTELPVTLSHAYSVDLGGDDDDETTMLMMMTDPLFTT